MSAWPEDLLKDTPDWAESLALLIALHNAQKPDA